jgi:polysaccharide deacetylase 2 family uncharacterized protein YibQ
VVIPDPAGAAAPTAAAPQEQKFAEMTSHGPVPKIAADGTRPADVFARPVKALAGKPGAPRVALIVAGLGVSTSATSTAIAQLPGPVTFAFMPYDAEVERLAALARSEGHEILLQVPMEPFNYPDNDPGPQTLLTSLTPEQNLERLYWLMSRMQGYVGLAEAMGARFTASEPAFAPILRETARRGLISSTTAPTRAASPPASPAPTICRSPRSTSCSTRCRRRTKSTARSAAWK